MPKPTTPTENRLSNPSSASSSLPLASPASTPRHRQGHQRVDPDCARLQLPQASPPAAGCLIHNSAIPPPADPNPTACQVSLWSSFNPRWRYERYSFS
jgi:hypothetical protein